MIFDNNKTSYSLADLLAVMQHLRDPETGCPWDLEQTPQSLTRYTIEECYELVDAIEQQDSGHICEELGDVLLQVVFYCQFAQEQGDFSFADVVSQLTTKLIRRHPHVFSNAADCADSQTVASNWESIKQQERKTKQQQGLFDDIPKALPALMRAQKLQKRAAQVAYDFSSSKQVLAQLKAEISELEQALVTSNEEAVAAEVGDVLFTCVNLARHLKLQAESCLYQANNKFVTRLLKVQELAEGNQQDLNAMSEQEREALWQQAKQKLAIDAQ